MSHMIDRMMHSGKEPWHGLSQYRAEITFEDAQAILCTVSERAVFAAAENGEPERPVPGYKAIVREDTNRTLCIQKETYGVVQYRDQLDVLNAAAGEGLLRLKTVGLLDEGRRCFALADIPSATFDIAGVELKPYLLMSTSHDSTRLLRYLFTGVYVVCNNTETAALTEAGVTVGEKAKYRFIPNVIQIRHTSKVKDHLATAKDLIGRARSYFGAFNEAALRLVNSRISRSDVRLFVEELFPATPEQQEKMEKYGEPSAPHKARVKVTELFEGGAKTAGIAPGTKWAVYNAVTEYIDHHAARRGDTSRKLAESRFESILFEGGAAVRQQALDLLLAAY